MRPDEERSRPAGNRAARTTRATDVPTNVTDAADDTPRCRRCHKPLRTELAVRIGLGGKCASLAIAHVTSARVTAAVDGQQTLPLDYVEAVVS